MGARQEGGREERGAGSGRGLEGERGPGGDSVVLNAAGALMLTKTGAADDWGGAIKGAVNSIDSGRAKAALEKLVEVSNAEA